ncbi:MAG: GNAT family N-acetyltransferase [Xanthomonadaceae bacterium]|nr:GNAT family N-acetyltransferase [Xanthomonadaceae bacterium]MDE1964359.1 GNAT family N-acetyltransferase [Xanthomonadaceae bacterium]
MPLPCDTEIVDGSLLLRPWRSDDAGALEAAVVESIDSLGRWLPWCRAGYDLAAARDWVRRCEQGWADGEHFAFGIFDPTRQRLLGSVGLNQRNPLHRSANLGYWVRQSEQRRGVATKAVRLAARFGFRHLGLQRIEVVALPDNQASRRTAERAGARFEAIARHRILDHGQPKDAAVYALVPGDLEPA